MGSFHKVCEGHGLRAGFLFLALFLKPRVPEGSSGQAAVDNVAVRGGKGQGHGEN